MDTSLKWPCVHITRLSQSDLRRYSGRNSPVPELTPFESEQFEETRPSSTDISVASSEQQMQKDTEAHLSDLTFCGLRKILSKPEAAEEEVAQELQIEVANDHNYENRKNIEDATVEEIRLLLMKNDEYLSRIMSGKVGSDFHSLYHAGGSARRNLTWTTFGLNVQEEIHEEIMKHLAATFCTESMENYDYVMKVLRPEAIIKVQMDLSGFNKKNSRQYLQIHKAKETASWSQKQLDLNSANQMSRQTPADRSRIAKVKCPKCGYLTSKQLLAWHMTSNHSGTDFEVKRKKRKVLEVIDYDSDYIAEETDFSEGQSESGSEDYSHMKKPGQGNVSRLSSYMGTESAQQSTRADSISDKSKGICAAKYRTGPSKGMGIQSKSRAKERKYTPKCRVGSSKVKRAAVCPKCGELRSQIKRHISKCTGPKLKRSRPLKKCPKCPDNEGMLVDLRTHLRKFHGVIDKTVQTRLCQTERRKRLGHNLDHVHTGSKNIDDDVTKFLRDIDCEEFLQDRADNEAASQNAKSALRQTRDIMQLCDITKFTALQEKDSLKAIGQTFVKEKVNEGHYKPSSAITMLANLKLVAEFYADTENSQMNMGPLSRKIKTWTRRLRKEDKVVKEEEKLRNQDALDKALDFLSVFKDTDFAKKASNTLNGVPPKDAKTHSVIRDYLVIELLLHNASRSGGIANIKVAEFEKARKEQDHFIIYVMEHKTFLEMGPLRITVPAVLFKQMLAYRNLVTGMEEWAESPYFFRTWGGGRVEPTYMSLMIGRRFQRLPNCPSRNIGPKDIRHFSSSLVFKVLEGNPRVRRHVATHMAHSEHTQRKIYNDYAGNRLAIGAATLIRKMLNRERIEDSDLTVFAGTEEDIVQGLHVVEQQAGQSSGDESGSESGNESDTSVESRSEKLGRSIRETSPRPSTSGITPPPKPSTTRSRSSSSESHESRSPSPPWLPLKSSSLKQKIDPTVSQVGPNVFQCIYCNKKFSTKGNAQVHVRTSHLNVKKFKCSYCGQAFGVKCNMLTHERNCKSRR